jgi:NAD(P)-dependent dehydrogenase (short-subunit alcohol dehydrogenase family)
MEGKVALVTGGSSGIGRATALLFAREGARVVIAGRNVERGARTIREIQSQGLEAAFIQADVSKSAEVEALVRRAVETYGRLDCAFNNAGVLPATGPTPQQSEQEWDRTIGVNLKGVWLCMKHEIPRMLKQGGGSIVNNASALGLVGSAAWPSKSPANTEWSG